MAHLNKLLFRMGRLHKTGEFESHFLHLHTFRDYGDTKSRK